MPIQAVPKARPDLAHDKDRNQKKYKPQDWNTCPGMQESENMKEGTGLVVLLRLPRVPVPDFSR